ncbi:hypothetical protein MNBD_GAMMA17-1489 [hydrothermal vent metagenome]|uniref:DUF58 domain-containing protein n=1 Tax=hydrothermal vent metagenome TaxID=652676 RepID=A0A3B1A9S1_9ZZZZ
MVDHAQQQALLSTAELAQLQQSVLQRRQHQARPLDTPYAGAFNSLHRGHGMELHDVRPYQVGDDIRHMDWRATARSGKATSKVFLAERQRSLFLVIDRRPSMQFGSRVELKATTAARCAAILAFAALAMRERVAGVVLGNEAQFFSSSQTLEGTLPLLQAAAAPLNNTTQTRPPALNALFEKISHTAERGSSLMLISDLHDIEESDQPALLDIASRFESIVLRITDPAEESLVACGKIRVISPLTGNSHIIDTNNAALREAYAETMQQRRHTLEQLCLRSQLPLHTLYNHRDTLQQLIQLQ